MSNPGNTGQRYHLRKLVSVELQGNKVISTLECGHTTTVTESNPEQAQQHQIYTSQRIGKRERCMKCQKAS